MLKVSSLHPREYRWKDAAGGGPEQWKGRQSPGPRKGWTERGGTGRRRGERGSRKEEERGSETLYQKKKIPLSPVY